MGRRPGHAPWGLDRLKVFCGFYEGEWWVIWPLPDGSEGHRELSSWDAALVVIRERVSVLRELSGRG